MDSALGPVEMMASERCSLVEPSPPCLVLLARVVPPVGALVKSPKADDHRANDPTADDPKANDPAKADSLAEADDPAKAEADNLAGAKAVDPVGAKADNPAKAEANDPAGAKADGRHLAGSRGVHIFAYLNDLF